MIPVELASALFLTAIAAGALMLWDLARERSCPECPHCRRIVGERREAEEKRRHAAYHSWRTPGRSAEQCDDARCEGRDRR